LRYLPAAWQWLLIVPAGKYLFIDIGQIVVIEDKN
jgi:hypothetical protein